MKARTPNEQLKTIRRIIGLTQQQLAARVGVSYPTILAVETGQRPMTKRLAMLVSCATGACPFWMMDKHSPPQKPLNERQDAFTREYFEEHHGLHRRWKDDGISKDNLNRGDEGLEIEDLCETLACLLRAAHKTGRFWACRYLVREFVQEIAETFSSENHKTTGRQFARIMKSERPEILPLSLLSKEKLFGPVSNLGTGDYFAALNLVSPMAKFRWSDAMQGDQRQQQAFLEEIGNLPEVVAATFSVAETSARRDEHADRKSSASMARRQQRKEK